MKNKKIFYKNIFFAPILFMFFIMFGIIVSSFTINKNLISNTIEYKNHSILLKYRLTSKNAITIVDFVKNLKGIKTCEANFNKNTIDVLMDARFRGAEIDGIVRGFEHELIEKH